MGDASPVPPKTNEDGHFVTALDELLAAYRRHDLFRMVMYDSGACSLTNAAAVRERHLHYTFRLDRKQPTLLDEGRRLLADRDAPDATTEERTGRGLLRRSVYITDEAAGYHGWSHLKTVLRVHTQLCATDGTLLSSEDLYYVSSLPPDRLQAKQWLKMLRLRWGVENQGHHTLDVALSRGRAFVDHRAPCRDGGSGPAPADRLQLPHVVPLCDPTFRSAARDAMEGSSSLDVGRSDERYE